MRNDFFHFVMMENNESDIMIKNGLDLNEVPVDLHSSNVMI